MDTKQTLQLTQVRALAASGEARERRLRARLSLEEVGEAVGATAVAVFRWENAQRRPHGAAALKYARLLERLERELG